MDVVNTPRPGPATRQNLAMLAAFLCVLLIPSAQGHAFHSAMLFPDDASVGGGGGLLYNGSPRTKGYTCATCHLDPPGVARLVATSTPAPLLAEGVYEPGGDYKISVQLQHESRGLTAKVNYNTFNIEVLDVADKPVGGFADFVAGGMVSTVDKSALFSRARADISATQWSFHWQAPATGSGRLTFYLAGVDGDGAGAADQALTDPLGDDVMVLRVDAWELGEPRPEPLTEPGCSAASAPSRDGAPLAALMLVLSAAAALRLQRTLGHAGRITDLTR